MTSPSDLQCTHGAWGSDRTTREYKFEVARPGEGCARAQCYCQRKASAAVKLNPAVDRAAQLVAAIFAPEKMAGSYRPPGPNRHMAMQNAREGEDLQRVVETLQAQVRQQADTINELKHYMEFMATKQELQTFQVLFFHPFLSPLLCGGAPARRPPERSEVLVSTVCSKVLFKFWRSPGRTQSKQRKPGSQSRPRCQDTCRPQEIGPCRVEQLNSAWAAARARGAQLGFRNLRVNETMR